MSAAPTMFVRLEHQVRRSVVYRVLDRAADAWSAGRRHSRAAAWMHVAGLQFTAMGPGMRVRAIAVFVAAFAFAVAALQRVVPARVAPATPLVWWIVVGGFASVVAALAEPVARGWTVSRVHRWWMRARP